MRDEVEKAPAAEIGANRYCLHLQSKKTFFLRGPAQAESDILDASQHCWCRKTMQAIGPDGEIVDPEDCGPGRACFASLL
jgi:hypothetical protein